MHAETHARWPLPPCTESMKAWKNPPSELQFHTFSAAVRPVRHGCLWMWAEQRRIGVEATPAHPISISPNRFSHPSHHPSQQAGLALPPASAISDPPSKQRKYTPERFKLHTNQWRRSLPRSGTNTERAHFFLHHVRNIPPHPTPSTPTLTKEEEGD